jgi:hypothetical protein
MAKPSIAYRLNQIESNQTCSQGGSHESIAKLLNVSNTSTIIRVFSVDFMFVLLLLLQLCARFCFEISYFAYRSEDDIL